jgi:hypothetical protein
LMAWRSSVRPVRTRTLRPCATASRTSAAIASVLDLLNLLDLLDLLDRPSVLQRAVTPAHPIAAARLGLVQRQQLRQMVFEYQTEVPVLRRAGPFRGQALAQTRVAYLGNQVVHGRPDISSLHVCHGGPRTSCQSALQSTGRTTPCRACSRCVR